MQTGVCKEQLQQQASNASDAPLQGGSDKGTTQQAGDMSAEELRKMYNLSGASAVELVSSEEEQRTASYHTHVCSTLCKGLFALAKP